MSKRLQHFFATFAQDTRGSILVMFGLVVVVLVVAGGMALDFGKQQITRNQLQIAADSAATSAASVPDVESTDRQHIATRYFNLNVPEGFNSTQRPTPEVNADIAQVEVKASANVPSTFMGNIGINSMPAEGRSKVGVATTSKLAKYDFILVLDESSSMGTNNGPMSKMGALIFNTVGMANAVLKPELDNRITAVKFNSAVSGQFNWTNSLNTAVNFFNGMSGSGSTNSSAGTGVAKLRVLGMRAKVKKVMILMSDGMNSEMPLIHDEITKHDCKTIRSAGVTIYTIGYGEKNSLDETLLKKCAGNDNRYFHASNADELTSTFNAILGSVRKIRITE